MDRLPKPPNYAAMLLLFGGATVFGIWFAQKQETS
jgi:hypothetical protein